MEQPRGELREVPERIRWARQNRTQFVTMTAAAESLGIKPGTYRTYEQLKAAEGRVPPLSEIQRIAKKFGVSWQWVALGEGGPDDAPKTELRAVSDHVALRVQQVPEEKRADVLAAIDGIIDAFTRKAG